VYVIYDVMKAYNGCRWTKNLCHLKAKLHFVEETLNRMTNNKKGQHWKNWRSKQTGLHSNSKLLFIHTHTQSHRGRSFFVFVYFVSKI